MYIARATTRFYPDTQNTKRIIPVGGRVGIRVFDDEPRMAYFFDVDTAGCIGQLRSYKLWHYFGVFPVSPKLHNLQEVLASGTCPSLLGEEVEPDGWDGQGFPSYLLAIGML